MFLGDDDGPTPTGPVIEEIADPEPEIPAEPAKVAEQAPAEIVENVEKIVEDIDEILHEKPASDETESVRYRKHADIF